MSAHTPNNSKEKSTVAFCVVSRIFYHAKQVLCAQEQSIPFLPAEPCDLHPLLYEFTCFGTSSKQNHVSAIL